MNRLRIPPRPGHVAWTYGISGLSLPEPLSNGDQVVIVEHHSVAGIQVRDANGGIHTLHRAMLDCGYEFEIEPSDWRHESDPEVIARLRYELMRIKAFGSDLELAPQSMDDAVESIARILLRQTKVLS